MRALWLLSLAVAAAGCGQHFAAANPLGPSPAPASAGCPSRYGFDSPGSAAGWVAPAWAPGISATLAWDGTRAYCGAGSLKAHLNLHGGDTGVLFLLFPAAEDVSGRVLNAQVCYAMPPPADLGLRIYFIDPQNNWVTPYGAQHYGQEQGWNAVTESFNVPGTESVVGILFQFSTNNGATYDSDVWIDEIAW